MENEVWKQIPEYPNYYISNLARVKNNNGLILTARNDLPVVDFTQDKIRSTVSVARLFYSAFVNPIKGHTKLFYRDGDYKKITSENLLSAEDRANEIIELYKSKVDFTTIANRYRLNVKTIKNILNNHGISIESKEFAMPKHNAKGKMEVQVVKGEFTIPYADNCTVKPKVFDANAYLVRQHCYNY